MYKIVNIGTKAIPMLANGATPYRFKQVFHMDLLKFFSEVDNGKMEMEKLQALLSS